ncbi:FecR family protein [Mucilaginibacter sp.]|uniref:FecR family protein n=1 Tax=Mucilaginibacter sp. TaxID=1882438 RepID=UPI0025D1AF3A|nr:FecR family protein [Mucilaginibacter sp.]
MITKNEFLALYQKYINGQCTPMEKELLDSYSDEMKLQGDDWTDDLVDEQDVRNRIWQKLNDSRKVVEITPRKKANYRWITAAAVLLIALFAGLFFIKGEKPKQQAVTGIAKNKQQQIVPGSNKAYLTLANGANIILDDAKNGEIAAKTGIKVSKTANGVLVYHFTKTRPEAVASAAPEFNTITTPRGGQYKVELVDGTKVWLNAASSLRFPQAFTGTDRQVELTGEAYFEVAKNKEKPFIVKANGTQVQVLGTHFNVNAYSDNNNITTTLLEGSVRMSNASSAVMLVPGQQGSAGENGAAIKVSKADTEENMAWINGFFVFHDESIVNVMKQVSRWYDVDIEYRDNVQQNEFGGTISRYKNINELLNNMQLTRTIHYKIEGRRVIIMK